VTAQRQLQPAPEGDTVQRCYDRLGTTLNGCDDLGQGWRQRGLAEFTDIGPAAETPAPSGQYYGPGRLVFDRTPDSFDGATADLGAQCIDRRIVQRNDADAITDFVFDRLVVQDIISKIFILWDSGPSMLHRQATGNFRGDKPLKYLHTMIRVSDIDATLDFFKALGLKETRRKDNEAGRYTLIFLAADETPEAEVELTHNWEPEEYSGGRNFGHLAFGVDDIHQACQQLLDAGITINRPPREGRMAFVRTPDGISIELLQKGDNLTPIEPWISMPNTGEW